MLAMWAVLASIFLAQGAKSRYEDASTGLLESDWYVAAQDLPMLNDFCENWEGLQHAHVFDLFSHSKRVCQAFQRKGFRGLTFDIRSCHYEDILSKSGFLLALQSALELCEHGLLMVAPPCSLFVPISASVHRRKAEQPYGNINNKRVRMSTLIAQNCGILISLILCWRPTIRLIVEQPKGSMLWKLPTFVSLIQAFGLSFVLTYLGFFGMDILKGSHLLTNMEQAGALARRATKEAKQKFIARVNSKFEKRHAAGRRAKVYYTCGTNEAGKKTFTGGKDLGSTSCYPKRFARAIFAVWHKYYQLATSNDQEGQ